MNVGISILSILGAIAIGAVSPGPSFIFVSRVAVAQSRKEGLAAAGGMGLGGAVYGGLGLFGLQTIIAQAQWLYLALKVAGGFYLLWIAFQLWRYAKEPLSIHEASNRKVSGVIRTFVLAVCTQLSNPKAAIVYASIFAAFLPSQPPPWMFAVLLPLIFIIEAGWYVLVALIFSSQKPRSVYLGSKCWLDRAAAMVMGLLGGRLLVSIIDGQADSSSII